MVLVSSVAMKGAQFTVIGYSRVLGRATDKLHNYDTVISLASVDKVIGSTHCLRVTNNAIFGFILNNPEKSRG